MPAWGFSVKDSITIGFTKKRTQLEKQLVNAEKKIQFTTYKDLKMMDVNYTAKLESALNKAIGTDVSGKGVLDFKGNQMIIAEIIRVNSNASKEIIEAHVLLSGDELEIDIDGEIHFMEKIENDSIIRRFKFWIFPSKVKFNQGTVNFDIIDINKFSIVELIR